MGSTARRLCGGFILAAWATTGGVVGCGGAGGSGSRGHGPVTGRASTVVVTYYYLPG